MLAAHPVDATAIIVGRRNWTFAGSDAGRRRCSSGRAHSARDRPQGAAVLPRERAQDMGVAPSPDRPTRRHWRDLRDHARACGHPQIARSMGYIHAENGRGSRASRPSRRFRVARVIALRSDAASGARPPSQTTRHGRATEETPQTMVSNALRQTPG